MSHSSLLLSILLFGVAMSSVANPLFTELVREDRSYFTCQEVADEKQCFEQYVAFSDQRVPTADPGVYIDGLRCAQFGDSNGAEYSITGKLMRAVTSDTVGTENLLKVRFYTKDSNGEPVAFPRRDLTYVLAPPTAQEANALAPELQVRSQNGVSVVRQFANYFANCSAIYFVSTQLKPFSAAASDTQSLQSTGRRARKPSLQ